MSSDRYQDGRKCFLNKYWKVIRFNGNYVNYCYLDIDGLDLP